MTTDATTPICLGTREIDIRTKKQTKQKTSALLMVCSSTSSSNSITVSISTGLDTYSSKSITPSTDSKLDTVDNFTSHLLQQQNLTAGVSVVCDYEQGDNNNDQEIVKVIIRQRLETGIVKLVWSGILSKDIDNDNKGCLSFLQVLGSTIAKKQVEQQTSRAQQEQLQTDLHGWKDTATKIEGAWQVEKDILLEQFHVLYKATHDELRSTKLALQQLENRHKAAGNDYTTASSNKKRSSTTVAANNRVDHYQPDDQDELIYDMATVERLAAGPKPSVASTAVPALAPRKKEAAPTTKSSRAAPTAKATQVQKPAVVPKVASSTDTTSKNTGVTTSKSKVGAVAVASVKDLFQDPVLKTKRKRATTVDEDVSAQPVVTTTSAPSTIKSSASFSNKKPKISSSVDEKKRKELELLSALMDD